jgi:mannose-6-phosphate isomerase-like protein (cupin superfamily)
MMVVMVADAIASWPQWRRDELAANTANGHVGTRLVSDTARGRVWHLTLQPGERLPFHRHVLDYFWTVTSPGGGKGRSHYGDGRVVDVDYAEGDTRHMAFGAGESMIHDLENAGSAPLSFVTVEYLPSANAPLPL